MLAMQCKYVIIGKEVGESGTPHLQGFVQFEDPGKTLAAVRKLNGRCHWEMTKGNIDQNVAYCSKEGNFEERGVRPLTKKRQGEIEKERWDLALESAKRGRWDEVPSDILCRYGKGLEWAANKLKALQPQEDTEERMEWYYGASGTGKSRKARGDNPGAYLKLCNKWWDDYAGQDVVIIEDFDREHKCLCHHLKIWADRYPFPVEIKGGGCTNVRPKKIIVTSNYHPEQIWEEEQDLEPIMRRFKVTRFDHVFNLRDLRKGPFSENTNT